MSGVTKRCPRSEGSQAAGVLANRASQSRASQVCEHGGASTAAPRCARDVGWVDDDRILQILIHIDIKEDGKVWIQENVTELPVDEELLKRGVPASDIVLGMHPPSYRQFTEFAER